MDILSGMISIMTDVISRVQLMLHVSITRQQRSSKTAPY